jgi:ATP-binding cassette subfamily A (ABC1) protein 3
MAIFSQTWTLTKKTLKVVFVRHWFFTSIRAFWAPIIFVRVFPHLMRLS